ncbi:F-box/LRR-repeat protein At3g03360 [Linum perenne]
MRKTKRNKSTKEQTLRLAADGKDLISELPDEVLHWILCCINSPRQAAKTIALARRWRSLWGSYPVVEFHHTEYPRPPNCTSEASLVMEQFQRFGEATIDRFRRDGQLRMESLSVSLIGHERIILHSFDLEQLLILSTTRKAEEISIDVDAVGFDVQSGVELPIQILANSSVRILRLSRILFSYNEFCGLPLPPSLSLNSLRFLYLHAVEFSDEQLFAHMIASAPFLETLEYNMIFSIRKLQLVNVPNLKSMWVYCCPLDEIEISAPVLETLHIEETLEAFKAEIIAPQLKVLVIVDCRLTAADLQEVISKLPSLKTLTLSSLLEVGKKFQLSIPKLEEFSLGISEMEEIELDAGPNLAKFVLDCRESVPDQIKKCRINNVPADCRWEADFSMISRGDLSSQCFAVSLKCFFSRFIQFHTVDISVSNFPTFAFHREEVGCTEDPTTIDHLKLYTDLYMKRDLSALLEALFWVCRPKFFTVNHWDSNSKLFFQALLNVMSQHSCEPLNDHRCWQYQLKDVKIIVRDVEQILDKEGEVTVEEEELIGVSEDLATSFATPNRVCFMLTWH